MKTAEILRKLADMLDNEAETPADAPTLANGTKLKSVEVDNTEQGETSVPIPPLQAKIELLKKSEGLPNAYDKCDDTDEDDELTLIKKNAGINTMAKHEMADDDEPFEG
jgi:hypothetical protein